MRPTATGPSPKLVEPARDGPSPKLVEPTRDGPSPSWLSQLVSASRTAYRNHPAASGRRTDTAPRTRMGGFDTNALVAARLNRLRSTNPPLAQSSSASFPDRNACLLVERQRCSASTRHKTSTPREGQGRESWSCDRFYGIPRRVHPMIDPKLLLRASPDSSGYRRYRDSVELVDDLVSRPMRARRSGDRDPTGCVPKQKKLGRLIPKAQGDEKTSCWPAQTARRRQQKATGSHVGRPPGNVPTS